MPCGTKYTQGVSRTDQHQGLASLPTQLMHLSVQQAAMRRINPTFLKAGYAQNPHCHGLHEAQNMTDILLQLLKKGRLYVCLDYTSLSATLIQGS